MTPLPPLHLAGRVGSLAAGGTDPMRFYVEYGARIAQEIRALAEPELGRDGWQGRRVLDFGCGAGRILRHLTDTGAELHGCDIDAPSIEWIERNMSPPLHAFRNGEAPPLDRPEDSFDLVYAVSVFTHIGDLWAAWLLELRRVLKPGGILIATFLGPGMAQDAATEPWDEERFGMNVLNAAQDWDAGGPTVLCSPWWVRAHWGRAYEILELRESGFAADPGIGHGVVVMRPRPGEFTREQLEELEPGEPREIAALRHNIAQLQRQAAEYRHWLEELQRSPSWRVTAPLRALKRLAGSGRR